MNYGHHVRDLLLELKRSDGPADAESTLPAYNDVGVAAALQDFKLHVQALQDQVEANNDTDKPPTSVRPSILLQNAACQRNKRGLLAYHWARLQRIQELNYWQSNEDTKNLSPAEAEFLENYESMIARYTAAALPAVTDLRAHCTKPPLTVDRVVVRVVDDTAFEGPVVLESGQTVHLTAGSTHYLQYTDCEEYIRSGALKLLETEEQEG